MIPDRANNVKNWEFDKLVLILLRQFKRLLEERGVELTDAQMRKIAQDAADRRTLGEHVAAIRAALNTIITESVGVLTRWKLTFAQSLKTAMTDIPGWHSTADFLQIANEKTNAEMRITAGSALLTVLGDSRHAAYLLDAIDHDLNTHGELDVDAIIAQRALLHAADINPDADDWRTRAGAWVRAQASGTG